MIKKIAVFSAFTLPYLGGIERYIDNLFKELNKDCIEIISVSTDYSFKNVYYEERGLTKYYKLPIFDLFPNRYPIIKKNIDYKKTIECIKKENVDAIIVNTRFHLTSLVGAKFGKKNNIPVFLIEHGSQHLTVDNKFLDFFGQIYEHVLTKIVERYVDYNYGVSHAAVEWQKHFGIVSDGIWNNSIEGFDFKKDIHHDKIIVTYAGRLIAQKGVEELIQAFDALSEQYENIELHIAGDGNQKEYLSAHTNNARVHFLGKLAFDELKHLYEKTDIFVYAPLWPEGLPTAILEAGFVGCAVIGSPQGGIKEIIEDGENGLLVNNKETLKTALERLIKDNRLRQSLGKKISVTVKEKYMWDITAKKIINDIEKKAIVNG